MTISAIMTRKVIKVGKEDTLQVVREIFETFAFHHLLVTEGRKLVGIISDRDLLKALNPILDNPGSGLDGLDLDIMRAHHVMSPNPITVSPQTAISDAAGLLLSHNISCLPVASPTNEVEGIVTWKDMLKHYAGAVTA